MWAPHFNLKTANVQRHHQSCLGCLFREGLISIIKGERIVLGVYGRHTVIEGSKAFHVTTECDSGKWLSSMQNLIAKIKMEKAI